MVLLDQPFAQRSDGRVHFEGNHQAASPDRFDALDLAQVVHQVVARVERVFDERFLLHDIQYGFCRRAGQRTAAEGGAQHAGPRFEHGSNQHARHRETVGDAFGDGNEIRTDIGILMCEELAGTAITRLDFVQNQADLIFGTELPQSLHEFDIGYIDARYSLDAFDDDRTDFARGKGLPCGFQVAPRQPYHMVRGIDRCLDAGIVGHRNGTVRPSVEGALECSHLLPAVMERCQLDGILVGFRTGIAEEKPVVGIA